MGKGSKYKSRVKTSCCWSLFHACYLTGFFHYFHRYFLSAYYVPACARHWRHRWKIPTCSPLSWCSSPCEVGITARLLLMRWTLKGVGAREGFLSKVWGHLRPGFHAGVARSTELPRVVRSSVLREESWAESRHGKRLRINCLPSTLPKVQE